MARAPLPDDKVYGGPTKRFFVSMLTRDIELSDAILDLIDNCVDGAMRQAVAGLAGKSPFKSYVAELTLTKKLFEISDNCGGIPDAHIPDAFSLGRPDLDKDGDLPTIGMYGIGMKRAIFKIGKAAEVVSISDETHSSVTYSADWLSPNNDEWDLPIKKLPSSVNSVKGVTISVSKLKEDIAEQFGNEAFINSLIRQISEHFGHIMQRGFAIKINGNAVKPTTLGLLSTPDGEKNKIRPFDYEIKKDGVSIKVTVGLFRSLAKEAEIDDETEVPRDQDQAGISVVCNDRIIVVYDKTMITGWGDGTVPRYHPQFRAIAGLIVFHSNNAEKLPISTTKRGLDMSSELYLLARKAAMEGIKTFTDFTNKWKGIEEEASVHFEVAKRVDAKTSVTLASKEGILVRGSDNARKYVPTLPIPVTRNERKRVSFLRDVEDIRKVSKYLFGDASQHPSLVGAESFERSLKLASKK